MARRRWSRRIKSTLVTANLVFLSLASPPLPSGTAALSGGSDQAEGRGSFGIPGAEPGTRQEFGEVTCYEYPGYLILTRPAGIGEDILVRFRGKAETACSGDYLPGKGDFEIKNEYFENFDGIFQNLLFIDSSSGPPPNGLLVYDLSVRKKVYETSYSFPIAIEEGGRLSFWTEVGPATKENCPDLEKLTAGGLEAVIEEQVILDLGDFRLTETAGTRCRSRQ